MSTRRNFIKAAAGTVASGAQASAGGNAARTDQCTPLYLS